MMFVSCEEMFWKWFTWEFSDGWTDSSVRLKYLGLPCHRWSSCWGRALSAPPPASQFSSSTHCRAVRLNTGHWPNKCNLRRWFHILKCWREQFRNIRQFLAQYSRKHFLFQPVCHQSRSVTSSLQFLQTTPGVHSFAEAFKALIFQTVVAQIEFKQSAGFNLQSFPDTYAAWRCEAAVVHPANEIQRDPKCSWNLWIYSLLLTGGIYMKSYSLQLFHLRYI